MNRTLSPNQCLFILYASLVVAAVLVVFAIPASGHGGKTHKFFTSLQALQTATELFDRLLQNGKLDETWETGLANVAVSSPDERSGSEFVITFGRKTGDPQNVYFFLTQKGKYAGSNFTGK